MKFLFWMAGLASVMAFVSVFAEAAEDGPAARVANKAETQLPASTEDSTKDDDERIPGEFEGASIEVGFSQNNEPEPHFLAVVHEGSVKLYQLEEHRKVSGRAIASVKSEPMADLPAREMPVSAFHKRVRQAMTDVNFFTARQPKLKRKCKDRYILKVRVGDKYRERSGCANQSNDPFAVLSQRFFRDAFVSWGKGK